jgi:large subunit ribosomal protein L17
MRHKNAKKILGRTRGPRKALVRALVSSLLLTGKITTTQTKAKVCKAEVERMITRAKKDSIPVKRYLSSRLNDKATAAAISYGKKYAQRPGGYTRIIRLHARPGDNATKVIIEFV